MIWCRMVAPRALPWGEAGEVTGCADQVMGDHGARHPCSVDLAVTGWQMCQRSVDQIGVDLFDDSVPAVLGFGLDENERGYLIPTYWSAGMRSAAARILASILVRPRRDREPGAVAPGRPNDLLGVERRVATHDNVIGRATRLRCGDRLPHQGRGTTRRAGVPGP
jgi:hypothetical protein